jgi:hypothetical protein
MTLESNLETAIAHLDKLVSLVNPEDPLYSKYLLAKNTAVQAIRAVQRLKIKKIGKARYKKVKKYEV